MSFLLLLRTDQYPLKYLSVVVSNSHTHKKATKALLPIMEACLRGLMYCLVFISRRGEAARTHACLKSSLQSGNAATLKMGTAYLFPLVKGLLI